MKKYEARRIKQLEQLNSGEEICFGTLENLSITIDELLSIQKNSPVVEEFFGGSATADVFRLNINGNLYTLKRKKSVIQVATIDGQVSFMNEVQRRVELEELKKQGTFPKLSKNLVETIYASFNHGIILSKWIEGSHVKIFNREIIDNLFETIYNLEINGFFEWDLAPGNIIVKDNNIKLYDFGYMYKFNPREEYNPDGNEFSHLYGISVFEIRSFYTWLIGIESQGIEEVLNELQIEKECALKYSIKKYEWLKENNADNNILEWQQSIIDELNWCLESKNNLKELYISEKFKCFSYDVDADIRGEWCTQNTLYKIDEIIKSLEENYELFKKKGVIYSGYEDLTKKEIIVEYKKNRENAVKWQKD